MCVQPAFYKLCADKGKLCSPVPPLWWVLSLLPPFSHNIKTWGHIVCKDFLSPPPKMLLQEEGVLEREVA